MNITTLGMRAFYGGKEYEFLDKSDGSYAIYSNDIESLNLDFKRVVNSEDRFMKIVDLGELDFVFKKRSTVIYKGDEFICSIIKGKQVMLYTRDIALGRKYNMNMRDRYEYYMYVDLKEVDEIIQRWIPYKPLK